MSAGAELGQGTVSLSVQACIVKRWRWGVPSGRMERARLAVPMELIWKVRRKQAGAAVRVVGRRGLARLALVQRQGRWWRAFRHCDQELKALQSLGEDMI
jgi:hypothetical protein